MGTGDEQSLFAGMEPLESDVPERPSERIPESNSAGPAHGESGGESGGDSARDSGEDSWGGAAESPRPGPGGRHPNPGDRGQAPAGSWGGLEAFPEPADDFPGDGYGAEASPPAGSRGEALLEGLNDAQRQAVLHDGKPLLILAGAGSGKTRVITRRIAHLIEARGVHPSEILAITFTNKAAREMRDRVEAECASATGGGGAWVSTFHSTCARILRREIECLEGYTRDFSIYDTADRNRLIKELLKRANYDATRFKPNALGTRISSEKNRLTGPVDLAGYQVVEEGDGVEDEVLRTVWKMYEDEMRRCNALDFDDLQLKVLEIFEARPGIRDAYAHRFRHVLVDEYQDTNRVQYRLVRHFCDVHRAPTVCGDPDQSIYGWRGADVRNILDFERDFEGAETVRLEQNYRSTNNILEAAQAIIANNAQRKEKDLWSDREEGPKLQLLECGDEDEEATEIARQIEGLRVGAFGGDPIPYGDMAIFYRVNFMQRALEQALARARIPYEIVSGTAFFERREIKDLVAYLRVLVNPADDESCRRVINVPARGVGDKSFAQLESWAMDRRLTLLRAASSVEARSQIRGRAKGGLESFAGLIDRLSPMVDSSALLVLDTLLEETNYEVWIQGLDERDATDRAENVEELRSRAETYDRENPEGGLRGFLQDIALVSEADRHVESDERVSLMTLHTAKGLEYPAVFMAGLEEEILPHARSISTPYVGTGPSDYADVHEDEGVEEERRLMYVGVTRAQTRLFLSWANTRRHFGQESWQRASRFLDEIPVELIEGFESEVGNEETVLGEYAPDEGSDELSVGDWVAHDHFGTGRIDRLLGSGVNARATVHFQQHGVRELLLQYARLKRIR